MPARQRRKPHKEQAKSAGTEVPASTLKHAPNGHAGFHQFGWALPPMETGKNVRQECDNSVGPLSGQCSEDLGAQRKFCFFFRGIDYLWDPRQGLADAVTRRSAPPVDNATVVHKRREMPANHTGGSRIGRSAPGALHRVASPVWRSSLFVRGHGCGCVDGGPGRLRARADESGDGLALGITPYETASRCCGLTPLIKKVHEREFWQVAARAQILLQHVVFVAHALAPAAQGPSPDAERLWGLAGRSSIRLEAGVKDP